MHDVSVVWVGGESIFFTTELLLHYRAGMCVNWNEHEVYILMCACALHDGTLEMGRVRWHGAINIHIHTLA